MVASAALFGNFFLGGPRLLALTWVLPLGLTSTLPWGAAFGSLIRHPRNLSFISLGMMGLLSLSGIFYPVSGQALWSQILSQASPVYWIGLGVRGALMPETAVVAEVGQSWRMLETTLVLIIWSLLGTLAAISIMRRSSRKEGGRGLMRSAWIRRRRSRYRGRHRA
jgi:ABC-2 type transporter